ncbi:MAG TPA: GNAT family N-acetyltransferase [Candidatus Nitrosotalea sp.]|nr:GNAT family N-acetyltransferase [Candidatus Nitrosotalea sp.]
MRKPRLDDLAASAAMWGDPEITRHITGSPSTTEQSHSRLLRYIGHWAEFQFGYWLVEESVSGTFVGEVGFAHYHRDIEPAITVPELGWVIARRAQRKGYATEAVRAAISWAQRHLAGTDEIACIIAPDNVASIRVAEKCGFTLARETSYMNLPTLVYSRPLSAATSCV